MNAKIVLLAVAVLAVGIIAMPHTLSLLTGQHTFYGGNDYPNPYTVQCKNCHNNIWTELSAGSDNSRPHGAAFFLNCQGCHRSGNVSQVIFFSDPAQWGMSEAKNQNLSGAHAAVTVQCTFCHDLVVSPLNDSAEPHKPLYEESLNETILKGGNEACTVCHTGAGAGSLPMNASKLYINATMDGIGNYIIKYYIQ